LLLGCWGFGVGMREIETIEHWEVWSTLLPIRIQFVHMYQSRKSWGALRVESGADMQVRSHFGLWADEFKRMCAGLLATTPSLLLTTFCCCCCAGAIDMANAPPSLFASSLPARRLPRTFCATVSFPFQRPPPQRRASLGMVCVCTAAPFLVT
jgi:hypothetical protein